jgi:hypothetical protein
MKSLVDALPPSVASQIDPAWRKNESQYWLMRDQLLDQYRNQWIGFVDGVVIASGTSPVAVFHAAEESGRHPFVTCVGREEEPCRMRRASFAYDDSYLGEALPVLDIEFRKASGSPGITLDRVIPDGTRRSQPSRCIVQWSRQQVNHQSVIKIGKASPSRLPIPSLLHSRRWP